MAKSVAEVASAFSTGDRVFHMKFGNATAAYWQVGEVAYALVSRGVTRDALEYEGERIAAGLR